MPSTLAQSVRLFYEALPFNYDGEAEAQVLAVRESNQLLAFPFLHEALTRADRTTVLDIGCGGGWFTNSAAFWYKGASVVGVDFTTKAVARAGEVARRLGVADRAHFLAADIFDLPRLATRRFDVVSAMGVLHHCPRTREAFEIACGMLRPGGHLLLGLYHQYGRRPLLEAFAPYRQALTEETDPQARTRIEDQAMARWQRLFGQQGDATFRQSWFRDQCLHPFESQWTLREVVGWLRAEGLTPLRASLDRFSPEPDWEALFTAEHEQEDLARQRIFEQETYFPGFFIVWSRKADDPGRP